MYTNRILFFLFLVISPLLVRAQSNNPVGGHFGVKVGATFTQVHITGTSVNIPKRALEPHLGLMYRYRLRKWVLQPEALLAIKGGTFQQEPTTGTATGRTTTKNPYYYASLPLLVGFIPTEGLTVQAGPEFSYALSTGAAGGPSSQSDVGVAVGVHYDFLDMLSKCSLHIRYIYGFTNVSPENTALYYNRNLQVSLVYNLYKPRKK